MLIYLVVHRATGKAYVGKTTRPRLGRYYGSGERIRRAVKRHGREAFARAVIDGATTLEELNAKEITWIAQYRARGIDMYNLADGGEGFSPEEAARAVVKAVAANTAKGWPHLRDARPKAVATNRATGWQNLKKGLATNKRLGWAELRKAGPKAVATNRATGWQNCVSGALAKRLAAAIRDRDAGRPPKPWHNELLHDAGEAPNSVPVPEPKLPRAGTPTALAHERLLEGTTVEALGALLGEEGYCLRARNAMDCVRRLGWNVQRLSGRVYKILPARG